MTEQTRDTERLDDAIRAHWRAESPFCGREERRVLAGMLQHVRSNPRGLLAAALLADHQRVPDTGDDR